MKSILVALTITIAGQAIAQTDNPLSFFIGIQGVWEASPRDSSFVSQLEYIQADKMYFLQATNRLMSKERKMFSYYEGSYFFNPSSKNIEFRTVNNNEMHSGKCNVIGDTLYHFASIKGTGKIKSYTSAIVKSESNVLHYYASYSESEDLPALKFENPLIYHRKSSSDLTNHILFIDQAKTVYVNYNFANEVDQSEKLITALMQEKNIPGLSIAVATKDKIVWAQGFGFSDLENKIPVRINSKFRIGSISKTLTALAIGKLIENKQLSLSDNVQKYVPYFPEKKYPVTIGDLVSHTAGIRDYNYKNGEFLSDKNYNSIQESVNIFKDDSLLFKPGSKYSYSTYSYVLLSAVIEGAANMDFINYMRDSIFLPMNLQNTVPDYNDNIIENRVRFYDESDGKIVNGYHVNNSNKWAGGGYLSTPYDLVSMSQNLLNNQFLKDSTVQKLWTPATLSDGQKINYCIGWQQDADSLQRIYVYHGGSSIGGRSILLVYPDEGIAIAMTSNLSTCFDQTVVLKIAEIFMK